ncbi:GrpB family protein [Sporolactobacillus shoreicorticis]|uniref:GrpB family protein n=1 Tax=Sporolactobacillus shoreicorticis TaxID=1923877 RepID=A0ABW5S6B4_9BACL|nr:GrpB family protein [Sporolactobacillus shoreicorticis]MCO7125678.1 GrpB family protein [Sporolactobacillus shoreicorticis]
MAQKEIQVVPYNEGWVNEYKREAARIAPIIGANLHAIHHIGSTAIPGIAAKPTIDILAEVQRLDNVDPIQTRFSRLGYESFGEYGIRGRRYFVKKDGLGNHLIHLHVFEENTENVIRHLAFRDYLKTHDDDAAFYGQLKLELAKQFADDRESYSIGKSEACKRIEQIALQWWYDA